MPEEQKKSERLVLGRESEQAGKGKAKAIELLPKRGELRLR